MTNKLEHVGVLGMKWGKRRGSSTKGETLTRQQRKEQKKLEKVTRTEAMLKTRSKNAADLKKQFVKEAVESGARRGKKVDAAKEEKYWDNFFKEELNNTTYESYTKERKAQIIKGVGLALAIVGTIAVKNYMVNTALKKAAGM